jgi:hypothetical protein
LPTDAAELRIALPEVELAKMSGWGENFSYRSRGPLPSVVATPLRNLAAGAPVRTTASVTVPEPGYYRVIATLKANESASLFQQGMWVVNGTVTEIWLLVTPEGGETTLDFDASKVPQGRVRNPGPFRSSSARALGLGRRTLPEGSPHGPNVEGMSEASWTPDLITYHAEYLNAENMQ